MTRRKRPAAKKPAGEASKGVRGNPRCDDAYINPRQLSPSMGDYGMDDRHMDGTEGFEDAAFANNASPAADERGAAAVDEGATGDDVPVPPPTGTGAKRAPCWNHMQKHEAVEDGMIVYYAICNYCKARLSAGTTGGTGHLNRHYRACLKRLGKTQGGGTQTQLNFSADGTVSTWVYNPQVAREEIVSYIISEDLPIMMGESHNFKNLIQRAFCPQYEPVSRRTTKSDLMSLFQKKLADLKETFKKVSFSFALTSDIWTSSHQKTSYVSVVAHYLDDSYALNKRVIGFRMMDDSHCGDAIAQHILEVLRDFKIQDKVLSITLDNASSNTNAIEKLTPKLQSYINGYIVHQRCVCHIINLVVQDGIAVVNKFLDNIRAAIHFITSTPQMISKFAEYCRANGMKPRKFGLDMKIRWNSTYLMLKNLQGYEKLITVFVNANAPDLVLTENDWYIVSRFREFLMPFYAATNVLSGIYYPTSCLVIDYIWLIADTFSKHRTDSLLRTVVDPMEVKFLKYFEQISHVYCFATIFDPRRKLDGLKTALEGIGDALQMDFSDAFIHVKDELFRAFGIYYRKYGESDVQSHEQDIEISDTSLTAHLWKRAKGKESATSSLSQRWNPNAELNHYLSTNFAATDRALKNDKVNLLHWWKEHRYSFPVLSHFARDILVVPVSTVSSEATFSSVGRIIEERRSSLAPGTVEAITCLKDWKRAEERKQHQLEDLEIELAAEDMNFD